MKIGTNDLVEDCRQILVFIREQAALTSFEMARVVQMIPFDYIRAEKEGKGLKLEHMIKAANLIGLKLTLRIAALPGTPTDDTLSGPLEIPLT